MANAPIDPRLPSVTFEYRPTFRCDKRKDGWILLEDTPLPRSIYTFQLAHILGEDLGSIAGMVMQQRAREMGGLCGQAAAESFIEHADQIPEGLRPLYLVFPGTTWMALDRRAVVPFLGWERNRWYLNFGYLDSVRWSNRGRVVLVST